MMDQFLLRDLNEKAFSRQPTQFVDRDIHDCLAFIEEVRLIEYGSEAPRFNWQNNQLNNLFEHAKKNSNFWRKKIPSRRGGIDFLKYIQPITREELAQQIASEGALLKEPDGSTPQTYQTSGSTGRPVQPFVMNWNSIYNTYRGLAEYVIHNRSFNFNRVKLEGNETRNNKITIVDRPNWAGPLAKLYQNGSYREIGYGDDEDAVVKELSKQSVGYLRCRNNTVERLVKKFGISIFKDLDVRAWVHVGDGYDANLVTQFGNAGIDTFSTYSCGEIGPIGFSCAKDKSRYHIATSNVIVEEDRDMTVEVDGITVSRLLITGLQSYATPLIRYDVGDFGVLHPSCPCGHGGPTLSHIYGRRKSFIRNKGGSYIPFYGRGHEIFKGLIFDDSRIKQISPGQLDIEICGTQNFDDKNRQIITERLHSLVGTDMNLNFILTDKIDWSDSPKRLFFTSYLND